MQGIAVFNGEKLLRIWFRMFEVNSIELVSFRFPSNTCNFRSREIASNTTFPHETEKKGYRCSKDLSCRSEFCN